MKKDNTMKKSILLACLSSTLSTGLIADEMPDFEAYLGAAKYFFDDDRNLDDANSLELGAEIPMTEALSLEAWFSNFDADVDNGSGDVDGTKYSLGGLYHFSDDSLRPFMSLGVSHQELENSNKKHDEALGYIGGGVKKYFDNNIVLRGELLAMNSFDNEVTDLGARIAIGYAFGRSTSKPVMEEAPVKKIVKEQSAPVKEIVVVKAAPQPAPKPMPKPVDSDNDGIIDSLDQCQGTNKAFKVDEKGCPVMLTETVSIDMNVKFPTNSAIITDDNLVEIKKVADFMQQFDKTAVTVEGYSDDRGRDAYNKSLSQKRADAVRMTLINSFKLDPKRVTAIGYGEENPIADNNTAEGRAANRRVVGVVKSTIQKAAVK
ncbi:MAG: OOP family OmpA-OmpF porin [Oleiphilaceae bacterium]|jgi:OOP family OmpA-OmpF porin